MMANITQHARQRMAQRNVSMSDINCILAYGCYTHCAGAIQVHLRDKDIPVAQKAQKRWSRLQGTTVVLSRDESSIITVWRNRQKGFRHLQRKLSYGH